MLNGLFFTLLSFTLFSACQGHEHPPKTTEDKLVLSKEELRDTLPHDAIDTSSAYLMGHFDPATRSEFVLVDTAHADRAGLFLRKDTYSAFMKMSRAAVQDGIVFTIRSATRNFDYQKGIWERKWTGRTKLEGGRDATTMADYRDRALAILRYSSMPGTSRHHWGTDIDLNSFDNDYFSHGQGKKEYDWLQAHATSFGFCQPYTAKGPERPHGYEEEKWHWSFIPVSHILTQAAAAQLEDEMISGFAGSSSAAKIEILKKYILGINQSCLRQE